MIVAGIGCRLNCTAEAIVALVREAGPVDMLAAPWFKRNHACLLEAARILGVPIRFVPPGELAMAIPIDAGTLRLKFTRPDGSVHMPPVGYPAIAEGCAVAGGGTLVLARIKNATTTCALALHPHPGPLPPAGEGEKQRSNDGEFLS